MQNSFKVLLILVFWYLAGLGAVYGSQDVEIRSHQIFLVLDGSKEAAQKDPTHMDADASKMVLSVLGEYNAASVLMSGKKTRIFSKLQYGFKEHSLHLLHQKIRRATRNSKESDFNDAIKTALDEANGTKYSDDIRSSIVLIMAQEDPVAPEEFMIDDLIESGIRLYIIRLSDTELSDTWLNWQEAAISTNGIFVTNKNLDQLPRELFEIYLGAVNPQLLEVTGDAFQVDRVTTEVTIVTHAEKDVELTFVSPENWRVKVKNGKTSNYQNKYLKIDTYGSMVMFRVDQPTAGLWALKGADQKSMVAMTKSRQVVKLLLPRRRFCENENLIITSYLARDGNIVRLQDKTEEIGFIAELLDASKTQVSSSPLLDDGKFPDTIRGDGVFSSFIPLTGREGSQSLRVVTRMQMLSRKVLDHIQVDPGSWVDIIEPYEPIMEGKEAKLLVELAQTLPYHSTTKISATYNGQNLEFKPDPAHRFRHVTTLPAVLEPGLHELVITKQASSSPLIIDKQNIKYNIKVIPEDKTKEIIIIFASLIVFLNISIVGTLVIRKWVKKLKLKKKKPKKQVQEDNTTKRKPPPPPDKNKLKKSKDTVENRIDNLEATFTPAKDSEVIDVVPKKEEKATDKAEKQQAESKKAADKSKKKDAEEEPVHAREMEPERMEMMDSVSDRIGDIVAAHIKDQVKGDVDQSGLSMDDLDHDGDPEYASSATLDAVDKMLDFGLESSETEEETEQPDSQNSFGSFSTDEMDELFGSFAGKFDGTSDDVQGTSESAGPADEDEITEENQDDIVEEDQSYADEDNSDIQEESTDAEAEKEDIAEETVIENGDSASSDEEKFEGDESSEEQAEVIKSEPVAKENDPSKPKATIVKNPSKSIPTDKMLEELFKEQEALVEEVEEES